MCCLLNLLILISHIGKSRTLKAAKMEIFVSTAITVVTKNFVLDTTGMLDLHNRL